MRDCMGKRGEGIQQEEENLVEKARLRRTALPFQLLFHTQSHARENVIDKNARV